MAGSGQMPDWPGVPLNVPRTGWGKISDTQYADDGKYGITEYVYAADSGDWVEAAHPPGYEDHDAYEIHGSATCAEGDLVQWWEGSLTDGTLVLFFEQHTGSHNYPLELDPDAITGDNETAAIDDWDVTDQGENDGVEVKLTTRVVYDDSASTPILYGFHRTFTYDSMGHLAEISAETRYTIDEPEDCP